MLALAQKTKLYPVWMPDRAAVRAPIHRRPRRSPAARALAVTLLLVIPAVVYVWQRTEAARSGYAILRLRQDVATLQADHDRLLAAATALKSPDRIERIATKTLGMVPPQHKQLAALTLPPMAIAADTADRSIWQRLIAWLSGGQAEAHESPR